MASLNVFANIRPVIMSGGAGTRLWPLSRRSRPKQFIEIAGDGSLFTQTLQRTHVRYGFLPPRVIGNVEHRFLMAEEIISVNLEADAIILEPFGRNTSAAIALAAVDAPDDELLLVLPSDHRILDGAAFREMVARAVPAAQAGKICCFGVTPDYNETGYGYIEQGTPLEGEADLFHVSSFKEKPNAETAQEYLESGQYSWNSGMFMFAAKTIRQELQSFVPGLYEDVATAFHSGSTDLDFVRVDPTAFEKVEDISIDYAVMEQTSRAVVTAASIGWSDLGSYNALHRMADLDEGGNAAIGDVVVRDGYNNYLHANGHMLAVQGVSDLIVVATDDVVMVASAKSDQDVKKIVTDLQSRKRPEAEKHSTEYRPWGTYKTIASGPQFKVQEILVYPGKRMSLQCHQHRAEHWIIVEGDARVTRDEDTLRLRANQSIYLPVGTPHRLENVGKTPLKLIEVQSGSYIGSDDIERIHDDYATL